LATKIIRVGRLIIDFDWTLSFRHMLLYLKICMEIERCIISNETITVFAEEIDDQGLVLEKNE
jgi:hypothetical protein